MRAYGSSNYHPSFLFIFSLINTLKSLYILGRTTKILHNAYRTKSKEIYLKGGKFELKTVASISYVTRAKQTWFLRSGLGFVERSWICTREWSTNLTCLNLILLCFNEIVTKKQKEQHVFNPCNTTQFLVRLWWVNGNETDSWTHGF